MALKTVNSSSPSALEQLWLEFERLAVVVNKRAGGASRDHMEKLYWIGYRQAMADMRSIMNVHIVSDLLERSNREKDDVLATLRPDSGVCEVQEFPCQKAG